MSQEESEALSKQVAPSTAGRTQIIENNVFGWQRRVIFGTMAASAGGFVLFAIFVALVPHPQTSFDLVGAL
jgi:hypothetical protein